MKKSLIALAVMAAAGAASAQSSVTLFGTVDATLAFGRGDAADRVALTHSGYNSSKLGFRGTEDLGGGMNASFWIEMGFDNSDGTGSATSSTNQPIPATAPTVRSGSQGLTFNRRSTVSLGGNWGELRLGRDYTPQFYNLSAFDPFGTNGVGTTVTLINPTQTADPVSIRASNSIGYLLPANLGGFYGQAMYYMGENVSGATEDDGTGGGVRVGYAAGPFNVAFAFAKTNFAAGDIDTWNIGGQWDFGMAKLMAQYTSNEFDAATPAAALDGQGWLIGGLIPVGAGEIRVAYSQYEVDTATVADPEVKKWAIGYVHNLSKRTALYATYAHISNSNVGATATSGIGLNGAQTGANGSSNGFDLGIRHSF